jgi:hypothetical protein
MKNFNSQQDSARPRHIHFSHSSPPMLFVIFCLAVVVMPFCRFLFYRTVIRGDTVVFQYSLIILIAVILLCSWLWWFAFLLFKKPGILMKFNGLGVGAIAMIVSVTLVPALYTNRITVTRDYFSKVSGYWFLEETRIDFDTLGEIQVIKTEEKGKRDIDYNMHCIRKTDRADTAIYLNDLARKALPEILKRASQRNIAITGNAKIVEKYQPAKNDSAGK